MQGAVYTPEMPPRLLTTAVLVFLCASSPSFAQSTANPGPPTVADAQAFIDRANADLLELSTAASHAEWVAETDITDDTEATTAVLNEQATSRTLALTAESHRFDNLAMPADLKRQIMLLQVTAPAAPKDPKLLACTAKESSVPARPLARTPRPAQTA